MGLAHFDRDLCFAQPPGVAKPRECTPKELASPESHAKLKSKHECFFAGLVITAE
jgi:hypothetical protein